MSTSIPHDVPQKQCTMCKTFSTEISTFFHRDKSMPDGFRTHCKQCRKEGKRKVKAPDGYKFCTQCGESLPATLDFFYAFPKGMYGLHPNCKTCRRVKKKDIPSGHRQCTTCKEIKPATLEHFRSDKRVKDGFEATCKICLNKNSKAYYASHTEQLKQYAQEYYLTHREHNKQLRNLPHNAEKHREGARRYSKTPAGKMVSRVTRLNRAAYKKNSQGAHTTKDITVQYATQKGKCYYCHVKVGTVYHVDHVIPLSKGGSNGPENLVIACPTCNLRKNDKITRLL